MPDRPSAAVWVFGPFKLLPDKHLLLRDGAGIALTPKAFDTLTFLIDHRHRVVSKDELLRHVWPDVAVEDGNLTQQIFMLRKALDDSSDGQRFIATVPRVGYRFVAVVSGDQGGAQGSAGAPSVAGTRRRPLVRIAAATGVIAGLVLTAVVLWMLIATRAAHYTFTQLTADAGVEAFPCLSPDGTWFVYASGPIDFPGESHLYFKHVGQDRAIDLSGAGAASDTQPALSLDGNWIAFRSERDGGGIFVMQSTGSLPRKIAARGFNPTWSPDGTHLAYSTLSTAASPYARTLGGRLRIVDVVSGAETQPLEGEALQPSWSPRGHRIAYWNGTEIFTVTPSGGPPTLAAAVPGLMSGQYNWNPVWAPDARFLYFSSNRAGTVGIWRIPIDELSGKSLGDPEPITTPSPFAAHMSFSRSGDRFLFASLPSRMTVQRLEFDPSRADVVGRPVAVTRDTRGWVYPEPSPDGRLLAMQSAISTSQEDLYVSNTDGTDLRQLTNDEAYNRTPRWSPDGKRLAFYSWRNASQPDIWVVNASGSERRRVTFAALGGKGLVYPVWEPHGARMAATGFNRGTVIFYPDQRWDPSKLVFLSDVAHTDMHVHAWSWSADGRRLAGMRAPREGSGILVFSFDTNTYEQLTTFGSMPVWLNDDRRLMFAFEDGLYVVDSLTKQTRRIARFPQSKIALPDGGGFSIASDNRAIYTTPVTREGDIWMARLTPGRISDTNGR